MNYLESKPELSQSEMKQTKRNKIIASGFDIFNLNELKWLLGHEYYSNYLVVSKVLGNHWYPFINKVHPSGHENYLNEKFGIEDLSICGFLHERFNQVALSKSYSTQNVRKQFNVDDYKFLLLENDLLLTNYFMDKAYFGMRIPETWEIKRSSVNGLSQNLNLSKNMTKKFIAKFNEEQ